MVASSRLKWVGLALLSVVQFMVVLDIAIVNVALPSIQVDLGFSQENLQWIISAYALVFGGFLLLGGRTADLLGRRRVFLAGLVVFSAASLLAGLAWSEGFGAAAGVLFGGILTDALSWPWIFYANVPVGLAAALITPFLLRESRDARARRFDALGAVLVTSGMSVAVFEFTQANDYGWGSGKTIGIFAASVGLLAAFGVWETRVSDPLMRFSIFRLRTLTGANVAGFILGSALFAMFLMLTLYMRQVLGYSPLKTGFGYLAVAGTSIVWANVAAQHPARIGVKPVLTAGMVILTAGLVLFAQVPADGSELGPAAEPVVDPAFETR